MWIFENFHMNISKFKDEFGCLPSTHVEASFKGWSNNHVRGAFSKSSLFLFPVCLAVTSPITCFFLQKHESTFAAICCSLSTVHYVHCALCVLCAICTVQCSRQWVVQYSAVQCSAVDSAEQWRGHWTVNSTVECSTVQYNTLQCSTGNQAVISTVECSAVQCSAVQCSVM